MLIGNSLGARIVLTMAATQPDRVRGMVLMSAHLCASYVSLITTGLNRLQRLHKWPDQAKHHPASTTTLTGTWNRRQPPRWPQGLPTYPATERSHENDLRGPPSCPSPGTRNFEVSRRVSTTSLTGKDGEHPDDVVAVLIEEPGEERPGGFVGDFTVGAEFFWGVVDVGLR